MDASGLIAFLRRRAIPGVEAVEQGTYRRSLRLPHGTAVVELTPATTAVQARYWLQDPRDLEMAAQRSRLLLDLDSDPHAVAAVLRRDPLLAPLIDASPGRRVPGSVDPHELAVRAVLGQQVSLAAAVTLAWRLVLADGDALAVPHGAVTHAFPTAEAIANADPERLAMPATRRRALVGLTRALASGEIDLQPGADPEAARRRLLALPGIGPWTAEYIAMRALRDPDAFLAGDLGVRHALRRAGHDGSARSAIALAERWRPYRAYAMQYLWGLLENPPGSGSTG